MKYQTLPISSCPSQERPATPDSMAYEIDSRIECFVFERMLLRLFPVPEGADAKIRVISSLYDDNSQRKVCVEYRDNAGHDYAQRVKREVPQRWDETASAELSWCSRCNTYRRALINGLITEQDIPAVYRGADPKPPANALELLSSNSPAVNPGPLCLGECKTPWGMARVIRQFYINGATAIEMVETNGDSIATLSVNLDRAASRLRPHEFFVKHWDVNEMLIEPALACGLFEDTGRFGPPYSFAGCPPIWRIRNTATP